MSTTDTIPEAKAAAIQIIYLPRDFTSASKDIQSSVIEIISQACLAYHKRQLAECDEDARLLAMKLWNKAVLDREGEIDDYDPYDIEKMTELLQLHTAKAVEEATKELRVQLQMRSSEKFMERQAKEELQKQCLSLETALADWHKMADQRSEALIKAQQQCEELEHELVACAKSCEEYGTKCRELRQQTGNLQECASCSETKYTPVRLDSLGGYVCLSCVLKERDELRGYLERAGWGPCNIAACNCNGWHQIRPSRRELELEEEHKQERDELRERLDRCGPESFKLERDDLRTRARQEKEHHEFYRQKVSDYMGAEQAWIARAEKAEQQFEEAAKMSFDLAAEKRSVQDQLTRLQQENQQLAESLTLHQNAGFKLQQDVKPLVEWVSITNIYMANNFLLTHPECKP